MLGKKPRPAAGRCSLLVRIRQMTNTDQYTACNTTLQESLEPFTIIAKLYFWHLERETNTYVWLSWSNG